MATLKLDTPFFPQNMHDPRNSYKKSQYVECDATFLVSPNQGFSLTIL